MAGNDLFQDDTTSAEPVAPTVPTEANYLEQLVGEDKKFKSAEDLARGKAEADLFVERLKGELQGLRDELKTRTSLEEFMDKMNTKQPEDAPIAPQPTNQEPPAEPADIAKNMSPEQIESLLEQKLTQREQEINQARNLEEVKGKLQKHFGEDYQTNLKAKALELGLGEQFLEDLAKSQPKAFSHLLGLDSEPATPSPVSESPPVLANQQNTAASFNQSNIGQMKFNDFEKIRKSDPDTYWSPTVQNKMHKLAIAQGEDFYT